MNDNLRRLRKAQALSRKDLANIADVDESTVCRLERGRTSDARPSTLRKLAIGLNVIPTTFLESQLEPGI